MVTLDLLNGRYARGELSTDEYDAMKKPDILRIFPVSEKLH